MAAHFASLVFALAISVSSVVLAQPAMPKTMPKPPGLGPEPKVPSFHPKPGDPSPLPKEVELPKFSPKPVDPMQYAPERHVFSPEEFRKRRMLVTDPGPPLVHDEAGLTAEEVQTMRKLHQDMVSGRTKFAAEDEAEFQLYQKEIRAEQVKSDKTYADRAAEDRKASQAREAEARKRKDEEDRKMKEEQAKADHDKQLAKTLKDAGETQAHTEVVKSQRAHEQNAAHHADAAKFYDQYADREPRAQATRERLSKVTKKNTEDAGGVYAQTSSYRPPQSPPFPTPTQAGDGKQPSNAHCCGAIDATDAHISAVSLNANLEQLHAIAYGTSRDLGKTGSVLVEVVRNVNGQRRQFNSYYYDGHELYRDKPQDNVTASGTHIHVQPAHPGQI